MKIKLECTPLGDKVKFYIQGKLFCSIQNKQLQKSFTLDRKDIVTTRVFGSQRETDAFLKRNRKVIITVSHDVFNISKCDYIT